jgi:nitroimidazol reductase NimA-like FMN-containing flavoprotein (pyridoxamine 5'-phosphate oxidase superfamily)
MSDTIPVTDRTRLRRMAGRGRYDRRTIDLILDEGFVCHLGVAVDGRTWVVPTAYARLGDALYLHGAAGNAVLKNAEDAPDVCVTVTLIDGLVLARSAFHHSINYRSVMVFGPAHTVADAEEKERALTAVVDHVVPGRGADARPPSASEIRATRVIRLDLTEASAKVRTGGPIDDPDDLDLPVWAGHIPLTVRAGPPVADEHTGTGVPVPEYAESYRRPGA